MNDFYTVEHTAILLVMHHMGFQDKWLQWVNMILASIVLLNGVPRKKYKCKWGVRQGDPLSPLILVLTYDLLHAIINK